MNADPEAVIARYRTPHCPFCWRPIKSGGAIEFVGGRWLHARCPDQFTPDEPPTWDDDEAGGHNRHAAALSRRSAEQTHRSAPTRRR